MGFRHKRGKEKDNLLGFCLTRHWNGSSVAQLMMLKPRLLTLSPLIVSGPTWNHPPLLQWEEGRPEERDWLMSQANPLISCTLASSLANGNLDYEVARWEVCTMAGSGLLGSFRRWHWLWWVYHYSQGPGPWFIRLWIMILAVTLRADRSLGDSL